MSRSSLPVSVYSAAQTRELDRLAIESRGIAGLTLMRRAAAACVEVILARWPGTAKVLVYCGSGNNAGDGYIVAGMLAEKNIEVTVLVTGNTTKLGDDATSAYEYCKDSTAKLVKYTHESVFNVDADVVVDALLGTGISGEVRPLYRDAIDSINSSNAGVLAVDIPSGLNADTGAILGAAVRADVTVTFIGLKKGLLTHDGPGSTGELIYDSLDVPEDIFNEVEPEARRLIYEELIGELPKRERNAHKNRFGHVLVVGGDDGMGGAVLMAAEAALRTGAGLVSVATHSKHAAFIVSRRPELMARGIQNAGDLDELLARASVIALGPGLGKTDWSKMIFKKVMDSLRDGDVPAVIDADGLNLLSGENVRRENWILTPHPGEASALLGDSLAENQSVQSDRFLAVKKVQEQYGGVVLLKGLGTLIRTDRETSLSLYGNPGMSTAGMGDVLSGVIAGLVAQHCSLPVAARLGAVVHSLAADLCAETGGERGLIATDLLGAIRRLVNDS